MKAKQITQEERTLMIDSILTSKEFITLQHEEDSLSMMYWKYSTHTDITTDELKDDMKYLDGLHGNFLQECLFKNPNITL
jgi:hypothetical protein